MKMKVVQHQKKSHLKKSTIAHGASQNTRQACAFQAWFSPTKACMEKMQTDRTLWQCANVAHLPGIYKYAITLPDGHEGYGFPIGGVAATDYDEGVISPGGVGYDINCGVRLLSTNLSEQDLRPKLPQLAEAIFNNVPSGLGSSRKDFRVTSGDLDRLVVEGVQWVINKGLGWPEDAEHCEEAGCMKNADPSKVSSTAKSRGLSPDRHVGFGQPFLGSPESGQDFRFTNRQSLRHRAGRAGYGYDSLRLQGLRSPSLLRLPASYGACGAEVQDYVARQGIGLRSRQQQRSERLHSSDGMRRQLCFL